MTDFLNYLKEWQTLAAGLLAVIAAIVTMCVVWKQLKFQKWQFDERLRRRQLACRAALPADLSTIMGYLRDCSCAVTTALQKLEQKERTAIESPRLEDRVIRGLQDLIEHIVDERNAEALAEILRIHQIQYSQFSRMLDIFNHPNRNGIIRITTKQNIEDVVPCIVKLYLHVESALPFSRNEVETIPKLQIREEDLDHALFALELSDLISEGCKEKCKRICLKAQEQALRDLAHDKQY